MTSIFLIEPRNSAWVVTTQQWTGLNRLVLERSFSTQDDAIFYMEELERLVTYVGNEKQKQLRAALGL